MSRKEAVSMLRGDGSYACFGIKRLNRTALRNQMHLIAELLLRSWLTNDVEFELPQIPERNTLPNIRVLICLPINLLKRSLLKTNQAGGEKRTVDQDDFHNALPLASKKSQ